MFKVAWRNLWHEKIRLAISVGGIALAVVLILVMAGVFAGSEEHAVTYIRQQPAALWLMQEGVENLHMSSSILPSDAVTEARSVPGVAAAVGLLYAGGGVDVGLETVYSYIFAVDDDAPFGGPWRLASGTGHPAPDEAVIANDLARRYNLGLGDQVNILGLDLTIAGLSEETFGIATTISFVNKQTLASLMGVSPEAASYVLVQPAEGADEAALVDALQTAVPTANILTQAAFINSDKEMIRQMGADIIRAMSGVAYAVGLLVIALTIYTATVERSREYGILKAIGADDGALIRVVASQALISTTLGFAAGVGVAYGLAALIEQLLPEMLIIIEPLTWLRQIPVFFITAAGAVLLPIGRISRLDPTVVFSA